MDLLPVVSCMFRGHWRFRTSSLRDCLLGVFQFPLTTAKHRLQHRDLSSDLFRKVQTLEREIGEIWWGTPSITVL